MVMRWYVSFIKEEQFKKNEFKEYNNFNQLLHSWFKMTYDVIDNVNSEFIWKWYYTNYNNLPNVKNDYENYCLLTLLAIKVVNIYLCLNSWNRHQ